MYIPLPVFCLSYKAALIPIVVNNPAVISPIEVPTLVGSEFGWPVTLISPPIPWTTISYAGNSFKGPVCPKPDAEA